VSESRQAPSEAASLRAGTMTERRRSGCEAALVSVDIAIRLRVSSTGSYYRKRSIACRYRKQNRWMFWTGTASAGRRWPARALCILSLLAVGCGLLATACDRGDHPTRIGVERAAVHGLGMARRRSSLAKLRGHTVVLNFWATYCIPCIEEVPSLVEMQRRMPQVTVVAISEDEDAGVYRQFLTDNHVDFVTVRDPSAAFPRCTGRSRFRRRT
jgi:hypothetical protein